MRWSQSLLHQFDRLLARNGCVNRKTKGFDLWGYRHNIEILIINDQYLLGLRRWALYQLRVFEYLYLAVILIFDNLLLLTVDHIIKLCKVLNSLLLTFVRQGTSVIFRCFKFLCATPPISRLIIANWNIVLTCETHDVAHFSLSNWLCRRVDIWLYAWLLVLMNQSMMTALADRDRQLFYFIFLAAFRELVLGNRLHVHRKNNKSTLVLSIGFDLDLSSVSGHDCLTDG